MAAVKNLAEVVLVVDDMDRSIRFYREIHGLAPREEDDDPIYSIALPRFWSLLEEVGVPATLVGVARLLD